MTKFAVISAIFLGLSGCSAPMSVVDAALRANGAGDASAQAGTAAGKLFGGKSFAAPGNGPDARDVTFGTVLPFGEIARVCDARGKSLGSKTDKTSARGFTLYDSAPELTSARTFYLTGFADKCPRQFTAANVLLGAPSLYETLRFSGAGANLPYAETDKAYDKVKSKVCRVGKRKPCGARLGQMDRDTVFVSAYERYDNNARWKEFLMHDGTALAAAVKSLN
ncbi:MAG: hypothetical protein ACSHWZ_04745 [Sulfitobacter sp.]